MNMKSLFVLMCAFIATGANAAIPYRVQQINAPVAEVKDGNDASAFAREMRFYIGSMYNFSMWDGFTDDNNIHISGHNTSSFEGVAGIRVYDIFRVEANYIRTKSEYNAFKLTGDTAMVNAIFDARIGNMYRLFYKQHLVPYVGVGGGASWNSSNDIHMSDKVAPVVSALAGMGIELGNHFTIDLGYRYFYMFSPNFDGIKELNPAAHQFRAGVRVNF